ncbi:MAG: hypothetical protein ARM1_0226 [Candidatus Micrarchaeota archaeon]|nr:MAG: hypothetical protein ARM1_0226 [Candidatus Micrarchaeota archaeon]
MIGLGLFMYLISAGLVISFLVMLYSLYINRRIIANILKESRLSKEQLLIALLITVIFALFIAASVKPTQQLFYDDLIYMGMAQQFIHQFQFWMCNYGSGVRCYSGQLFHEPPGASFIIALFFIIFGSSFSSAYAAMFFTTVLGMFLTFILASIIFKDRYIAFSAEILYASIPIIYQWAFSTTNDMPLLVFFIISLIGTYLYISKKDTKSFMLFISALAFLLYIKVDALLFALFDILLLILVYRGSIRRTAKIVASMNTINLILLLAVIFSIAVIISYDRYELLYGNYGVSSSSVVYIPNTCASRSMPYASEVISNSTFSISNLKANICGNLLFWFNAYTYLNTTTLLNGSLNNPSLNLTHPSLSYLDVPQTFIITLVALLGIALMIIQKRDRLNGLSMLLIFISGVIFYSAFYAGSVLYGVDVRFMLPFEIIIIIGAAYFTYRIAPKRKRAIGIIISLILTVYSIYTNYPFISIPPSHIQQAAPARYYEIFIQQNAKNISKSCIVFDYDPYIFQLYNLTAAQSYYIYNKSFIQNVSSRYSCAVFSYDYWCNIPPPYNSDCNYKEALTNTKVIAYNSTYNFSLIEGSFNLSNP